MRTNWMLAPARIVAEPLLPRPVRNGNTPGFPTTAMAARAFAREIKAGRAKRVPWRIIAEKMSISRIEAIRLAHSLDEVLDEIRSAENPQSELPAAHRQV